MRPFKLKSRPRPSSSLCLVQNHGVGPRCRSCFCLFVWLRYEQAQVGLGTSFVYVRCWFCTCGLSGREVCGKPSTEAAHFPCPSLKMLWSFSPLISSENGWLFCLHPPHHPPPPPLQLGLKKNATEKQVASRFDGAPGLFKKKKWEIEGYRSTPCANSYGSLGTSALMMLQ